VTAEWREAVLLPIATRNAYFEDILLDAILASIGATKLSTLADAERFVDSKLSLWVKIDTSAVVTGVHKRLSTKAYLFNNSSGLDKDSNLGKLLKIAEKSLTIKSPIISQAYDKDVSKLVFVVPNYDDNDEPTLKCVSQIVAFGCALHSTKPDNVAVVKDSTFGDGKLTISSSLSKLLDTFISSAHHPQGLFLGEVSKMSSGFQGNLVAMLAAMRLLNMKSEFIRRRKFAQGSKQSPTSYNTLQETFNVISGLKTDKSMSYTLNSVKAILSSCVKAHNKGFPGGWINTSRSLNQVKTDFAVISLLGWVEKVPSQHKMLEVLFNTVDPVIDPNKKNTFKLVNITQDKRNFSHQEFRTAVALTLPRVFLKNKDPVSDSKLDPLSVKELSICNNFCSDRRDLLVDRLNECYGFKVSLKNPKSKTKEIHYRMSRDRLLAESANIPLITAEGTRVETFSELPKPLQKFFRDTFRYPIKRAADEQTAEQDVPMEGGVGITDPPTELTRQKRVKLTKGKAAEALRKSGRLANASKNKA
jgi:hypothetical protein